MIKNYLKLIGLPLLVVSTSAFSMQFTSTIHKLKLPLLMSVEQPPSIKFIEPGQMKVTASRMCGDGDVAHFHEQNPNFDFVPSEEPKLDVIVGYWIVEKGATDINPTKDNWYPMAYSKIKIEPNLTANSAEGSFQFFNDPNKEASGIEALSEELKKLFKVSSKSFGTRGKEYQVYSSVISCVKPDDDQYMVEKGKGNPIPSPLDIITSLDEMNVSSFNERTNSIKITQISTDYKFTFGEEGNELKGRLFDTFRQIMAMQRPKDLNEYKQETSNLNLGITKDPISFCQKMNAGIDKDKKRYSYELFPMNLTCKKLFNGNELTDAYEKFMNPPELPDNTQFEILQKNLAKRFLVAAGLEVAQERLDKDAKIIKTRCAPKSNQKPIDRIVASYPLKFISKVVSSGTKYEIVPNEFNHLHPESLFAIRDYMDYYSKPELAIWGQVLVDKKMTPPPSAIEIKLEKAVDNPFLNLDTVKLNINIKVRSVGGSCNGRIYC